MSTDYQLLQQNKSITKTEENSVIRAYNDNDRFEDDDDEIDLRELWSVLIRRKGTILLITFLVFLAALVATLMMQPIYRATTTIQIKPETTVLDYDVEAQGQRSINDKDFYQTQYELLKSRNLAQRTIDELGLEPRLRGEQVGQAYFADSLSSFTTMFSPANPNQEELDSFDNSEASEAGEAPLEDKFLANLSVSPVKNSQIITLHYDDTNPELAADIINALADNFINMNLERRAESATYARDFIKQELEKAKGRLLESEEKLVSYAREKEIISIDPDNKQTLTGQKLAQLAKALASAEEARIKAESKYEQAQASSDKSILGNSTVQELKKELARAEARYQAELVASSAYDNSVVRGLRSELAQLQGRLQAERVSSSAHDNSVVRGLRSQLVQLQSQLQGELTASNAYKSPAVQSLNSELQGLQAEYQEKLQIYKPAYPLMVQLKQKINEVNAQVKREVQVQKNTTANNLKQRIKELQSQIGRETRAVGAATQGNLQQRVNELKAQIQRETSTINTATQKNLEQRINELQSQISREMALVSRTIDKGLEAELLIARQQEKELKAELISQKTALLELEDKSVGYNTLKREVEENRNLFAGLLQRMNEVTAAAGVGSNNISIVDKAVTPYAKHKPNTKLNLALGLVLGLFVGTVVAFLLEFLDDRIKTENDLDRILGLPILGMAPLVKGKQDSDVSLLSLQAPTSATAEAFRSLRTNLMFSTSTGAPHTLLITSSMPSEAKSSTCTNLATAFAQAGKRILIVDADLRKPTMHKRLKLDNTRGLSTLLTHQVELEDAIQQTPIENVVAIPAGTIPPNPAELLSSERMLEILQLAPETFDIIIVDAPPVMGLADALILANRVSATILVAAHAQSKKRPLADAYQRLQRAHANIIGTVFTKVKSGASYGYSYDYYYAYGDSHSLSDDAKDA